MLLELWLKNGQHLIVDVDVNKPEDVFFLDYIEPKRVLIVNLAMNNEGVGIIFAPPLMSNLDYIVRIPTNEILGITRPSQEFAEEFERFYARMKGIELPSDDDKNIIKLN